MATDNSQLATGNSVLYGCLDPDCGYRTLPSTMGTPYSACPLCRGAWGVNPPDQTKDTGQYILSARGGQKNPSRTMVRPHLRDSWKQTEGMFL